MHDDELLDALGAALRPDATEPDASRVAEIRAAAEARRDRIDALPVAGRAASAPSHGRWLLAAAAALVVVALGVAALTGGGNGPDGDGEYAGPIAGEGGGGRLSVVETGIGRVVDLDSDELAILPKGEFYEVWFVGPGDAPGTPNRISAGTFHPRPDGVTDVTLAAAVDPSLYPVVEVTAEPGDGDPSPSGVVLLRVDTAS